MAPFALSPQQSERRSAQQLERPSPRAGGFFFPLERAVPAGRNGPRLQPFSPPTHFLRRRASSTPPADPSNAPTPQVPQLPGTAAALAGVCTFFGVGLLLFLAWKYYLWKQKKKSPRDTEKRGLWSPADSDYKFDIEKGGGTKKIVLFPEIPRSPSVMWHPAKLSPWIDPRLPKRPPSALKRASQLSFVDAKGLTVMVEGGKVDGTPLPHRLSETHRTNKIVESTNPFSDPAESTSTSPSPSPPPEPPSPTSKPSSDSSSRTPDSNSAYSPASTAGLLRPPSGIVSSSRRSNMLTPLSPRHDSTLSFQSSGSNGSSFPMPRLVVVSQAFPVTLHDELEVKVGETLRLLQEFKDGWTLCQRVGRPDAEKGAVPACCLAERSSIISSVPNTQPVHKRSRSSTQMPSNDILKRTHTIGTAKPVKRSSSFLIGVNYPQHHQSPGSIRLS